MNKLIIISFLLLACLACFKQENKPVFELMEAEYTGINFENRVKNTAEFNIFKYRNFYNGGGVSVGDINNDSLPDIFFSSNMGKNKLYLNKGNFKFEDISNKAGIEELGKWNTGVVMVDINHDNLLDIYVCNAGIKKYVNKEKNKLFINNGDLTFTESAEKYGLDESGYTTHAAFFDYDLDGDLDCYILNNSFIPVNTLDFSNNRTLKAKDWPVKEYLKGGGHKLLRNDNDVFVDVSEEAGIFTSLISFGLGVTIGDINNDLYPDIYVSNDFYEKDYLYVNQKNGTFKEEIEDRMKHISLASMGADMADINNDGFPEIITTDMLPEKEVRLKTTASFDNNFVFKLKKDRGFFNQYQQNCLQLNNQDGTFSEIGNYAGVSASDWSWGALIFDADNNGFNDIFVANGIYHDLIDQDFIAYFANDVLQAANNPEELQKFNTVINKMPSTKQSNYFFQNNGSLKFEEKAKEFGLSTPSFSNGAAYADLDNDGDLDLVVNNVNMPSFVYQNQSNLGQNSYIKVKLLQEDKNTYAIGAKINVFVEGKVYHRVVAPSRGFQSSTEYTVSIGLGNASKIDSVQIVWPLKEISTIRTPKLNSLLSINKQNVETRNVVKKPLENHQLFKSINLNFESHKENEYDDFYKEKNIPSRLSLEGPKAASGDVNNDGLEDVYICGGKDQAGQLYIQTKSGDFKKWPQKIFETFAYFEDTVVELFDANNDGNLDMVIGTGGNEKENNSREYLDRLYLNDGKGNFEIKSTSFPSNTMNTGVILPLDFDADGDLDLFVGSRSYPMEYGLTPPSFVYENQGNGQFTDATNKVAKSLRKLGLIRDVKWVNIDHDPNKELIIVGDWMSPKIFKFNENKFVPVVSNLTDLSGFWGAILAKDIDNDGDIDLVLGNIGDNSNIKASNEKPTKLWVKDFDNNGYIDKIMTKTIDGKDYPYFLKTEMLEQFPALKKSSLKFSEYAKRSIQELFSPELMNSAEIKEVNFTKSIMALNNGNGNFEIVPLPEAAQLSSINAIAFSDVNSDNYPDLLIGGNFTNFIPQFGTLDASRGTVLINKKNGHFEPLKNVDSGFTFDGELRQILPVKAQDKTIYLCLINNALPKVFSLNAKK